MRRLLFTCMCIYTQILYKMTDCYRYTLRKDDELMIDTFFTEQREAKAIAEYVLQWLETEMDDDEEKYDDLYDYVLSNDFEFSVDQYNLEPHTGPMLHVPGYRRESCYVWACGSKGLKSIDEISAFKYHQL